MLLNFFYRLRQNFRDTRGVSLIITLGLTMMLIMVATGVTKLVLGFMQTTKQGEQANVAYLAAEGGIEMALYDLAAYEDGYETVKDDANYKVCDSDVSLSVDENFTKECNDTNPYRFMNFTGTNSDGVDLSGGRGFWRLFARTLVSNGKYHIPNPYFAGNKDGILDVDEWGTLTKGNPTSWSLLVDDNPGEADPADRFLYLLDTEEKSIVFNPGEDWSPDDNCVDIDDNSLCDGNGMATDGDERLLIWTLSALDGGGNEFTLQGVVWESDFNGDCDGDGTVDADEHCFIFDLNDNADHIPDGLVGDAYAGEDINNNLTSNNSGAGALNRVSGVLETFNYATPFEFIEDLNTAMNDNIVPSNQWTSARLTINLIATLSEASGVASNSLSYKLDSDEVWADGHTYIISEGFAGDVKQTIETRFRRGLAIPIFSYVIFQ